MTSANARLDHRESVVYNRQSRSFPPDLLDPTVMVVTDTGEAWAAFIRRQLHHRGWSITYLARVANLNRGSVSDWANGRNSGNLTIASIFAVADAFDVDRMDALRAAAAITDERDPEVELIRASNRSDADKEAMIRAMIDRREQDRARRIADLQFILNAGGKSAS